MNLPACQSLIVVPLSISFSLQPPFILVHYVAAVVMWEIEENNKNDSIESEIESFDASLMTHQSTVRYR